MKSIFKNIALHICLCFWSFGSFAQIPERINVCTMTLNSSDEAEVFRQYLPEDRFRFIELVPRDGYSVSEEEHQSWFTQVCQNPRISCDMLIISGHFAGMFFGTENDHILSLSEIEQISCWNSCPRIFDQLKEVFLFGCNTMAHKGEIHRTPEQYLNILLEYDLPLDIAERVVAGRFSVLDLSYKEKMEHIFSEQTKIYGFTELSPLGSQARGVLNEYLSGIKNEHGSYYNYLNDRFYRSNRQFFNSYFHNSFSKLSAVEQSYGMTRLHPEYLTFQRTCHLYNPEASVASKISTVRDLFREQKGLQSFSAIKNFLLRSKNQISDEDFRSIQNIPSAQETFLSSYSKIDSSLIYMRSIFLQFLNIIGWLPRDEYRTELTKTLAPVIEDSSLQSFQILESLFMHDQLSYEDLTLNNRYFTRNYLTNIWSVITLDFLHIDTPEVRRNLMDYCLSSLQSETYVICYQVLKTLGHLRVQEEAVYARMFEFLNHEDYGMIYYALYGLAYSNVDYPQVHLEIVKKVYHENFWIRLQAIRTLSYLGLVDQESELRVLLREVLETEEHPRVIQELREVLR